MSIPAGGHGAPLVFDTSAWQRQRAPGARELWLELLDADRLAVCPVVALELCAAARDKAELMGLEDGLASLTPQAPVTEGVGAAARAAVRSLGAGRRLPAADYLIAAAAAERGFGVLHDDRHFDLLCEVLGTQSLWIAPRGSLD